MKESVLTILIISSLLLVPWTVYADSSENEETFTLSGNVYTMDGFLANTTSIKVDSMPSMWSENGSYVFPGISPGEHTVRAYFMNDGHTVVYRKMIINSDMELDWHEGMNWVTAQVFDENDEQIVDSPLTTIELMPNNEIKNLQNDMTEFELLTIGEYYSLKTTFGDIDNSTHNIYFKLNDASPNDFDLGYGKNSRYGFITDVFGNPMSGVTVSNGEKHHVTNSDGFYLLENLEVDSIQTLTFSQENIEIIQPVEEIITSGVGWLNLTSELEIELPRNVSFSSTLETIPQAPFTIEWEGGAYTDYYSLYMNGELVYAGTNDFFWFNPEETGTFEFQIEAVNTNGSNKNPQSMLLIVLPDQSDDDLWSIGMSWNYSIEHTPQYYHNRTYTAIGSEVVTDAFGNQRDSYLVRVNDDSYEDGEKAYRWVDANNLLNLKTYWVDAPASSSYFQEGQLGWNFTNEGKEVTLLSGDATALHFNRTNIIGVPGHPNGYDDTQNLITVTKNVMVETPAGVFSTTYFNITDVNDGVLSWELWYNETVRNWVKIIDRLPGSHSDSVISVLTAFEVPLTPQFTTEEGNLNVNEYSIDWATFQGATSYQLFENEVLIYEGDDISFNLKNKQDGEYLYKLNAIMNSGQIVEGDTLLLDIFFILEPPEISASDEIIIQNQIVNFTWNTVENIAWYSIIVENSEGVVKEIYNGTQNFTEVDFLEIGQNRIRLQAALQNGKISDLSPSIFVTVEELTVDGEEEIGRGVPAISLPSTVLAVSLAIIFKKRRCINE